MSKKSCVNSNTKLRDRGEKRIIIKLWGFFKNTLLLFVFWCTFHIECSKYFRCKIIIFRHHQCSGKTMVTEDDSKSLLITKCLLVFSTSIVVKKSIINSFLNKKTTLNGDEN